MQSFFQHLKFSYHDTRAHKKHIRTKMKIGLLQIIDWVQTVLFQQNFKNKERLYRYFWWVR